ncbi:MAG: hypothetical protein CVV24_06300 [Ignavibacteriae bacterium HGW-Ignavibacteriae-3]|nr:MAG: hypothetical protein CVV24_06300 [Ignavibacteriae bacterium HGW-Ignavibacteriae-3]
MIRENIPLQNKLKLYLTLLFVYIVLFEFILPVNKILPRPTLLLESFVSIWFEYNLLYAFTITASVVYLSMLFGFIQIYIGAARYLKFYTLIEGSIQSLGLFLFLTPFFFLAVFNFWFPQNVIAEFLFSFLAASFFIFQKLIHESKNIKEEYLLVARNLKTSSYDTYQDVHWKSSLPGIFKQLRQINYQLWFLILTYEFIGDQRGVGAIYHLALQYRDFTALFTLAIMCGILIWFGDLLIKQIHSKFIRWTP